MVRESHFNKAVLKSELVGKKYNLIKLVRSKFKNKHIQIKIDLEKRYGMHPEQVVCGYGNESLGKSFPSGKSFLQSLLE